MGIGSEKVLQQTAAMLLQSLTLPIDIRSVLRISGPPTLR
jgi:hypothetical protein